jgi:hypothetical protein
MCYGRTINGRRIDVLINGGFGNLSSKKLLIVGLIALSVKPIVTLHGIPITVAATYDPLNLLSGRDTWYVLKILVHRLELLVRVISPKLIKFVCQTALQTSHCIEMLGGRKLISNNDIIKQTLN